MQNFHSNNYNQGYIWEVVNLNCRCPLKSWLELIQQEMNLCLGLYNYLYQYAVYVISVTAGIIAIGSTRNLLVHLSTNRGRWLRVIH